MWQRGHVAKRTCGKEGVWQRGRVAKRACGKEGVWQRGRVAKRACGRAGVENRRAPDVLVRTRELHTGLSPDKFALCSSRTGHPGRPVPAKPERKIKRKAVCPVAGTPTEQIRTALPARSPTEAQWPKPAPAEHPPVGRRRRPLAKIVAGRAPKSAKREDAAVNLPKKGKGVTDSTIEAWKGMYSWVLWSGNQRSEGDGHPLLQCIAAPSTRRRPSPPCTGPSGAMGQGLSWPPPPT
jgi:hypothetical protein